MTHAIQTSFFKSTRSGSALLLTIGTLAVLALLAVAFVNLSQIDATLGRNYVTRTRAALVAESGLSYAIGRLEAMTGVLSPQEMDDLAYTEGAAGFSPQPSFATPIGGDTSWSGSVSSSYVDKGDRFRVFVDELTGKLNINDSNAKLPRDDTQFRLQRILENLVKGSAPSVNAAKVAEAIFQQRDLLGGRFHSLAQVTAILLQEGLTIAEAKGITDNVSLWGWQDPNVIRPNPAEADPEEMHACGNPIMRWEEAQTRGYELEPRCPVNINTASEELLSSLMDGLSGWAVFEGPAEFLSTITPYAMVEPEFLRTNYRYERLQRQALASQQDVIPNPPGPFGRPEYKGFFYDACMAKKVQVKQGALTVTKCFGAGVEYDLPYARTRQFSITKEMASMLASDIWTRVHENDDPFESWEELKLYLDDMIRRTRLNPGPWMATSDPYVATEALDVFTDNSQVIQKKIYKSVNWLNEFESDWGWERIHEFGYFNEFHRDLLLANFDPNTLSNDFNPDRCAYRTTDKADLLTYSTEFCFSPMGYYRIRTEGAVMGGSADVASSVALDVEVRVFDIRRLTSQAQLTPLATDLDRDEMLGVGSTYSDPMYGFTMAPKYGTHCISYPEPIRKSDDGVTDDFSRFPGAVFDGRVGLTPLKVDPINWLGWADLVAYFEGATDILNQYSGGWKDMVKVNQGSDLYSLASTWKVEEEFEDRALMASPPVDGTLAPAPGTLYPDGIFSEAWKTPCFEQAYSGYTGNEGTVCLAVKPNFFPELSNRTRCFFSLGQGNRKQPVLQLAYLPHRRHVSDPMARTLFGQYYKYYPKRLSPPYPQNQAWSPTDTWGPSFPNVQPPIQHHPYKFGPYWTPTRSMALGSCARELTADAILSATCNQVGADAPYADEDRDYRLGGEEAYHFEGHRWNMLAFSWSMGSAPNPYRLSINGGDVPYSTRTTRAQTYISPANMFGPIVPGNGFDRLPIRLGSFARRSQSTNQMHVANPADCTYGQFHIGADQSYPVERSADNFDYGFYYNNPNEVERYTTPEIDLGDGSGRLVTVRSVSYTLRWPEFVKSRDLNPVDAPDDKPHPVWGNDIFTYNTPAWIDLAVDDPAQWDPMTFDMRLDPAQPNSWLSGLSGDDPRTPFGYEGGTRLNQTVNGSFQLRFFFNVGEFASDRETLRESPFLDDITIVYSTGIGVLRYEWRQ